jgi:hypothetical protein
VPHKRSTPRVGSADKFLYFSPENQPIASIPELSEGDKSHQKVKRRMFHMREPSGKKRSYSFVK